MNILFWALTIGVVGKILLAIGVLMAHMTIAHEHRIDDEVLKSFRFEHKMTIIGIVLIVIGYIMEIYFYGYTPFSACGLEGCGAALNAALSQ